VLAGNQQQELSMKYEDSGKFTRDAAIAPMVHQVRASRNLRIGQSASSSVEAVSGPQADPWFVAFENTFKDVPAPPPAPPEFLPAVLPSISLASGPVNFNNGVPVGGWSNLSVYPNGWFNMVGHFHDSGAPSYNVDFVWSIYRPHGVLIQIATQGHMAGTFESGSRDYNWNVQQNRPDIAAEWANLSNGYSWRWDAHVQWDVAAAMDSIRRAIQVAEQIVSVIAIIV
jgi:hypothetical protein